MPPRNVQLKGLLGTALAANHQGRLSRFITDEQSEPIALFHPERSKENREGDWYGEHAGKWLWAAAKAAHRTGDEALAFRLRQVADHLVKLQAEDGYLGTYAEDRRFMRKQPPGPRTWDGAPGQRTWDVWTHSYLVLGLLEVHRFFPNPAYLLAARKIGDLCFRTLSAGDLSVTELGNHHGMSATVLLDPAMELYFATGEERYLHLAQLVARQAEARPELALLSQSLAGVDAAEIATGKAYQLAWNLVGLAKLYRATQDERHLKAVHNVWNSIRTHHLTLGGGPWGGVALRSREVFNPPGYFSPHGYVETCSILAWLQLNKELWRLTGEAVFAEEIERSAYNDLLGAQAPNGEDWCYYSFPNGKRVHTTYWRCCKSSGAMALEELPEVAYVLTEQGELTVNLYGASEVSWEQPGTGRITLTQETAYPFDGAVRLRIHTQSPATFALNLRIPSWAQNAQLSLRGEDPSALTSGGYVRIERTWENREEVTLSFPMAPVMHRASTRNVQESKAPDGSWVQQEVLRHDYVAFTRGPLVYATGLIDGFKHQDTQRLRGIPQVEMLAAPPGCEGPVMRWNLEDRAPLLFHPYFEAGGRKDGAWRLTWMNVESEHA